jgi:hypothetical protein
MKPADHCTCGHANHAHLTNGDTRCTVVTITGPPSDHPARDDDHGDRTETPCPCTRFTTDRNGHAIT